MRGNLPRDPVCGLEIHPDDVDSWVEYGGTQYYFCCPECQKAFEETPDEYAEVTGDEKAQPEVHHKEDGRERHTKHQARV
jgi:YHS domain-containing protein